MSFDSYLDQAWTDHATDSMKVSQTFSAGLQMVETPAQLNDMAFLMTHVMGEHLGQWQSGIQKLSELRTHKAFAADSDAEKTIQRSVAAFELVMNPQTDLKVHSVSDQIRILTLATTALCDKDISRAQSLLGQAIQLAETRLDAKDPANRSLAIAGNNLAAQLEEKSNRSAQETDFMVFAAKLGRRYWEIAGTPVNVLLAEYRLAKSYMQARQAEKSRQHAQLCLEICEANKGEAYHFFQGYEALAYSEKSLGNEIGFQTARAQAQKYYDAIAPDVQQWYTKMMDQLRAS